MPMPLVERPKGLRLLCKVRTGTLDHQPEKVCFPDRRLGPKKDAVPYALRGT